MLVAQVLGILAFLLVTIVLGVAIRRDPSLPNAQRLSRISHLFFWGALLAPQFAGALWPGWWRLDELAGVPPLPLLPLRWVLGLPLGLAGMWLVNASIRSLNDLGQGQMAFKLTRSVVTDRVFRWTRNPMSLGYYLQSLALGLLTGSTWLLGLAVLGWIPVHAFNLRFFEERELRARLGNSYAEYQQTTPFLIPRWPLRLPPRAG